MKLPPILLALGLLGARGASGEEPLKPFPAGYADAQALASALQEIGEEYPRQAIVRSLTRSSEGRDVWLVELRDAPAVGESPNRPAILIVANLEADHLVGSQIALALIERMAKDGAETLRRATIYVVPRLNPDGAERLLAKSAAPIRTNLQPIDRDRDGRSGEDGPDDVDGDGSRTTIRVRDTRATLLPDEKDPRILRKADAAKGETPVFSEYPEGADDDGDGALNEDPPGGVNLARNWPHRWDEHDPEAGRSPVSEPETRALIRFAFDHPEIVAVWALGLRDNLREEPKREGSGLDGDDVPILVELSKAYRKAMDVVPKDQPRIEGVEPEEVPGLGVAPPALAPSAAGSLLGLDGASDGTLADWAYQQFGVLGLASRPWIGPTWEKPPEGQEGPPGEGEARWLFWNDRVLGGAGFAPLRRFDHPTLGPVLVGGWKPGVRLNPPTSQVVAIADAHFAFLAELAGRVPSLAIPVAKARPLGGGLHEITAVVENRGTWPTALAQGVRTRQPRPVLVRLEAGEARIVAGKALERVNALPGAGGRREFRWIVAAPRSDSVTVEAATPKAGRARVEIELKQGRDPERPR